MCYIKQICASVTDPRRHFSPFHLIVLLPVLTPFQNKRYAQVLL